MSVHEDEWGKTSPPEDPSDIYYVGVWFEGEEVDTKEIVATSIEEAELLFRLSYEEYSDCELTIY